MMNHPSEAATNGAPYDYDPELKKITLRGAETFPEEILERNDVEVLDMSGGHLRALPKNLGRLANLKTAFFSYNDFETLPPELADCPNLQTIGFRACAISEIPEYSLPPNLRALILTDNKISALPRSIGECTDLQKLTLTGNRLASVPRELENCQNLEIVRFSANQLAEEPEWLFHLPRLAWYADSSNLYRKNLRQHPAEVSWDSLQLGEQIGKSNNNLVYRARMSGDDNREVAVKLFGNHLGTDGLANDDMNACLQAGEHPNIVGGIGRLVGTPEGQLGLVMPLVSGIGNLGNPPSLATVCHDTYPEGKTFSLPFVTVALQTSSSAMQYLHSRGIMHGDFYAHNVLTDNTGECSVGDFGAATLYTPGSAAGALRERIDVRAFGYLMDELLSRCPDIHTDPAVAAQLQEVKAACLRDTVAERPSFAEIANALTYPR
jgi:hypothetical protein